MRGKIFLFSVLLVIILPVIFLFLLAKVHHRSVHQELVNYLNTEFRVQVTVNDFSLSYIRHFPHAHIELKQVEILDEDKKVAEIGDLDVMLNLAGFIKRKIKIERLVIRDAYFLSVVDSLGNTARILRARDRSGDSLHQALILECRNIHIKSSRLLFRNAVKGNRTCLRIDDSRINLRTADLTILLTGHFNGQLDSLISNKTVLFSGQPIKAEDVTLAINRINGVKELLQGRLLAHTLVLIPRARLEPHDDGNLIDLSISGEGDFNTFLDLFAFHFDLNLLQVNEEARLMLSYNQHGFVNPFLRPYSELDFEISGARFESEDLPFPIEISDLAGNYNNGVGHSPETVELQIDTIRAFVQESFIGGHFRLSNLNDPLIDAHIVSTLELAHLFRETANLKLSGQVDLDAKTMDIGAEVSLSDLFFRTRKERMLETQEGIVKLDSDARVFLKLYGPLNNHKLNLVSKKKFFRFREDLVEEISGAEDDFRDKSADDMEQNPH